MKKRILQIACFILTFLMLPVQAFAYTGQMDAEQLSGAAAINFQYHDRRYMER